MVAASAPDSEYAYLNDHTVTPIHVVIGMLGLTGTFLAILVLTGIYVVSRARREPSHAAIYLRVRLQQLKYLSGLAVCIGAVCAFLSMYRTLIIAGIHGSAFDSIVGPIGEALIFLVLGFSVAGTGFACMLLVLGRGSSLTRHEEE